MPHLIPLRQTPVLRAALADTRGWPAAARSDFEHCRPATQALVDLTLLGAGLAGEALGVLSWRNMRKCRGDSTTSLVLHSEHEQREALE